MSKRGKNRNENKKGKKSNSNERIRSVTNAIKNIPGVLSVDYNGIDPVTKGSPGFQWGGFNVSGRVQVKYKADFVIHQS